MQEEYNNSINYFTQASVQCYNMSQQSCYVKTALSKRFIYKEES